MGEYVIIKIPALTTERRKELTKIVAKYGEEAKVSIRNIRHDYLNKCKKSFEAKELSETDKGMFEKKLDENVKDLNARIDKEVSNKSDDVMKV
jgi:ribosome recycling factor